MVLKLHKKLVKALRQRWPDLEDRLDDVPETGRVLGVVISSGFDDLDYKQRQDRLWKVIKRALSAEEEEYVGPIAVLTPAEATVKA